MLCRLFRNIEDIEKLSELGVLFLLFEMGLELSLDRLKVIGRAQIPRGILPVLILDHAGPTLPKRSNP